MYEYFGRIASYYSRGCLIKFENNVFSEENAIVPGTASVLMHEYSHWFQDVATISGWIGLYGSLLYSGELKSKLDETDPVVLPINAADSKLYEDFHQVLNPKDEWWHNEPSLVFSHFESTTNTCLLPKMGEITVSVPHAVFRHESGRELSKRLGILEVRENYAAAITELHGGITLAARTAVAYRVIYDIGRTVFGGDFNALHVVALCHHALNHPVPGQGIQELIEQAALKFPDYCPSAEDLLCFSRDYIYERYVNGAGQLQLAEFEKFRDQYISAHPGALPTATFNWLFEMVKQCYHANWDQERSFPLDTPLVNIDWTNDDQVTSSLEDLFAIVPLPLVLQPDGSLSGIPEMDQDSAKFLAYYNLIARFLLSGKSTAFSCVFYKFCSLSVRCDSCCTSQPWTRGKYKPTCMMGEVSKFIGMHEKSFV